MKRQKGATLIIVMVLLIIITGIGTLAIRESLTSLNIATNSQATQLMLQNSDAYFFSLESADETQKIINASKFGLVGFASQPENIGKEISYCYVKDSDQIFDVNDAGVFNIVQENKKFIGLSKGFCDPDRGTHYTSGRKVVLTQISIKVDNTTDSPLENFIEGTSTELVNMPIKVKINTFSLLPSMTPDVSATKIKDCLRYYPAEAISGSGTIYSCLKENSIPFNAQSAEYQQSNAPQ